ncbi:MAG: hypothetical protein KDC92_08190 [Bacteroidetes bacterium]|nr:hypothetical protein [Bacteroidota bacterium]
MKRITLSLLVLMTWSLVAQAKKDTTFIEPKYQLRFNFGQHYRNNADLASVYSSLNVPNPATRGRGFGIELLAFDINDDYHGGFGYQIAQWEQSTNQYAVRLRAKSSYVFTQTTLWAKGQFELNASARFGLQWFQLNVDDYSDQSTKPLGQVLAESNFTREVYTMPRLMAGLSTHFSYRYKQHWKLLLQPNYMFRAGSTKWEGFMGRDLTGPIMNRHMFGIELGLVYLVLE